MSFAWRVTFVLLALALQASGRAAESKPLDPHQAYAQQASWAETMIATRNNCAAWAKDQQEGHIASTPLAAVWARMQADWPVHATWFRQDLPGDRYLDWFLQADNNPHFERWILRALPRIAGTDDVLQRELDELTRGNVPTSDPRWLELWARAHRWEDIVSTARRIWLGDLRVEYQRQAAELVRSTVSPHDHRWTSLRDWTARCAMPGKAAHAGNTEDLASAAELLAAALPGRFSANPVLARQMADAKPRWTGLMAAILKQDAQAVTALPTLYDMARDGADIRCLSPHETNEWHPSVTHDGRIAWTRWDYVDRHFSAAHMPWITTPDGCDPRPIHGNYAWRGSRPDMELNLRAIPNSPKFVATAAPHHGQAFGSLVMIDPRVSDDDGGSPLKRLTPDAGFPETGDGGTETYGCAWPLNEDYHLCVYDANTRRASPNSPVPSYAEANYGLYLVDAFGNRELIYRDPDISCHQPIPRRPRPKPPVVTENSSRPASAGPAEATVAVMDVYDSLKPWPAGTKISALRVWQILPLSVAPAVRNNGIQVPGTGSVNRPRRFCRATS